MSDELADRIRARRLELGLTQAELAEQVGRAPSTIGSWEAGRSAPADAAVLETLTHVLDLDAIEAADDGPAAHPEPVPSIDSSSDDAGDDVSPRERFELEQPPPVADTGSGEPITPAPSSDGGTEDEPMQRTEPTTVVVARSRRVAARLAERLGTPATVATVQPVRTDIDPMYRVRAVATLVLVVALGAVFLWAVGRFAAEAGQIFDGLLAPWR